MANVQDEVLKIEEDTQKGRFLTFTLGQESFGIGIKNVTEIVGLQKITVVPELPGYIKGIINLRGQIIPVMDMRLRFKRESKKYDERTCIIVINVRDVSIGLIVDRVAEVLAIADEDIAEPPQLRSIFNNKYIKQIGKVGETTHLLLDCEKLFTENEFKELSDAQ